MTLSSSAHLHMVAMHGLTVLYSIVLVYLDRYIIMTTMSNPKFPTSSRNAMIIQALPTSSPQRWEQVQNVFQGIHIF